MPDLEFIADSIEYALEHVENAMNTPRLDDHDESLEEAQRKLKAVLRILGR